MLVTGYVASNIGQPYRGTYRSFTSCSYSHVEVMVEGNVYCSRAVGHLMYKIRTRHCGSCNFLESEFSLHSSDWTD